MLIKPYVFGIVTIKQAGSDDPA